MNPRVYFFIKAVADFYRCNRQGRNLKVLEIGSRRMIGQEGYADFRRLFVECTYLGVDLLPGVGVDHVVDFSQSNEFDSHNKFDIIICTEVLEHVKDIKNFCINLNHCMSSNTLLLLTTPFFVEIHGSPHDYWRFSQEGLQELLSFLQTDIMHIGLSRRPLTYVCLGRRHETTIQDSEIDQIFALYRQFINLELRYFSFLELSERVIKQLMNFMPGIFEQSIRTRIYRSYIINKKLSLIDSVRLLLPPKIASFFVVLAGWRLLK